MPITRDESERMKMNFVSTSMEPWLRHEFPEFSREARLKFLYSALSSRKEANAVGYSAAIEWWQKVLRAAVEKRRVTGSRLTLRVDASLPDVFRIESIGRPLSIGTVVIESEVQGKMARVGEEKTWSRKLWNALTEWNAPFDDERNWARAQGVWVFTELVKEQADVAWKHSHLEEGSLHSLEELTDLFGVESILDARLLVDELVRKGRAHFDAEHGCFKASKKPISGKDLQVFAVMETLSRLNRRMETLHSRWKQEHARAVEALKDESYASRKVALSHIRAKKGIEHLSDQAASAKESVMASLVSIEQASTDQEVLHAMQKASDVLKQSTNVDAASIVDDWIQSKASAEDMSRTIAEALDPHDLADVDAELEQLQETEKSKRCASKTESETAPDALSGEKPESRENLTAANSFREPVLPAAPEHEPQLETDFAKLALSEKQQEPAL